MRSGSRNNSTQASVTGPEDFSYTFDLTGDWFDISTESSFLNRWEKIFDPPFPFGDYTFQITFSDGHTESRTYTLPDIDVTPVNSATMAHEIHEDGTITFSWGLPEGVTGQKY